MRVVPDNRGGLQAAIDYQVWYPVTQGEIVNSFYDLLRQYKVIAYLEKEGGVWKESLGRLPMYTDIHAVKFEGEIVWDEINGIRHVVEVPPESLRIPW